MLRTLIVTGLILVAFGNSLKAQDLSTSLVFEERVFKFDTIEEKKGKVTHIFSFQNKGKNPVTISNVHSACGCIGNVVTKGAISPGATGKITITFDPAYKSGFFSKEIVVLSNEGKEYNRIWVEGVVKPSEHPITEDYPYSFGSGLYLRLKVMAFGYMKPGESRKMELHYANNTSKEMNLGFILPGSEKNLQFTNPGKIAAKAKGVISFSYTMPQSSSDEIIIKVYPTINNKKLTEPLLIKILKEKSRN